MDVTISDNTVIESQVNTGVLVADVAVTVTDNVWGDEPNE